MDGEKKRQQQKQMLKIVVNFCLSLLFAPGDNIEWMNI